MLKPLGERLLIKLDEKEEKSKGGIILMEDDRQKPQTADVIELGDGASLEKHGVKKGDKIIISRYSGTDVKYEGESYMILKCADVMAILEEEEK